MKVFFRTIHLYLSLASGIVIMIACLTGAILVFEKELQMAFNHDRYYSAAATNPLPVDDLVARVRKRYPEARVGDIKIYADPTRNAEIGVSLKPGVSGKEGLSEKEAARRESAGKEEGGRGKGQKAGPEAGGSRGEKAKGGEQGGGRPTHTVFVSRTDGQVVELYSYRETFFYQVFALHRWLLGSSDGIGKYIVGVSTFIFLFILLTGIILWWPKTGRILKQRLNVKWDGGWKRLNHDLHLVLGFYSAIFLFIFSFTAMSWSFKWFNKGIYTVTGTTQETPEPPASVVMAGMAPLTAERAFSLFRERVPEGISYQIRAPRDSAGVWTMTVLPEGRMENASDTYYLDQYTGKELGTYTYDQRNLGQKVRSYVKPVHTGSVFGMPSKVISFIVCLLGTSFPVTGVILWLNRLKKERSRKA
ncbi:MAG TPA: PepSY-associated TM helix domain-containing protein [Sphingobacteriaceae bacterium]